MDLAAGSGWFEDPNAGSSTEVGLGWRGLHKMAVLGYAQPDHGAAVDYPHGQLPQGVVGLNFELRTR
jgi:hypothetical protein